MSTPNDDLDWISFLKDSSPNSTPTTTNVPRKPKKTKREKTEGDGSKNQNKPAREKSPNNSLPSPPPLPKPVTSLPILDRKKIAKTPTDNNLNHFEKKTLLSKFSGSQNKLAHERSQEPKNGVQLRRIQKNFSQIDRRSVNLAMESNRKTLFSSPSLEFIASQEKNSSKSLFSESVDSIKIEVSNQKHQSLPNDVEISIFSQNSSCIQKVSEPSLIATTNKQENNETNNGNKIVEINVERYLSFLSEIVVCQSCARRFLSIKERKKRAKMNEKRTKITQELLSTESIYVSNLNILLQHFLIPLMNHEDSKDSVFSEEHKKHFEVLKSDITILLNYNGYILRELENRWKFWSTSQKVADLFLRIYQFLKSYTAYIGHYQKALIALGTYANNPKLTTFLSSLQYCPETNNKGIRDFLIMPVQRIPRYILLLKQLVSNTWTTHSDFHDLNDAYEKICQIAEFVESSQQTLSSLESVMTLQSVITGKHAKGVNLVAPHRRLVRQVAHVTRITANVIEKKSKGNIENKSAEQLPTSRLRSSSMCDTYPLDSINQQQQSLTNQISATRGILQKKQFSLYLLNDLLIWTKPQKDFQNLKKIDPLSQFSEIRETTFEEKPSILLFSTTTPRIKHDSLIGSITNPTSLQLSSLGIYIVFSSIIEQNQWYRDILSCMSNIGNLNTSIISSTSSGILSPLNYLSFSSSNGPESPKSRRKSLLLRN